MKNMPKYRIITRQGGVSLVELMVGLAVGLIVIAAIMATYIAIVRSSTEILGSSRLNETIRGAMDFMVRDIRRAGSGSLGSTATSSPFMVENDTNIQIGDSGKCILFAYDKTYLEANQATVVDDADRTGYRQMCGAVAIKASPDASCGNVSCPCPPENSEADWECLTDNNMVNVSSLSFDASDSQCFNVTQNTLVSGLCSCGAAWPSGKKPKQGDRLLEKRLINVAISGNLIARTEFTMSLEEPILVANDRIISIAADCP